ncbi:MAG TPA: (Fe-S)-binding protein, partial [bacterium]|nr:(Fe-S)-binding protein [bacterium]
TLYYPGCMTRYKLPELQEKYEEILRKLQIDFMVVEEVNCCGSPVLNASDLITFKDLAEKNLRLFKNHGIRRIVTGCPACYRIFANEYPKVLKDEWDIKSTHFTQILADLMDKGKVKFNRIDKSVTYHDPCHLGRHMNEYKAPRKILKAVTDKFVEMEMSGEISLCCGGGGGVSSNFPEITGDISEARVLQALDTKADILVSACPMCDYQLAAASAKKIEVLDIVELIYDSIVV